MNNAHLINERIDIRQLAEQSGSKLVRSGDELRGNCPLHHGNNKSGFVIYDHGRRWKCFTGQCGSGDGIDFLMKLNGLTFSEVSKQILGDVVPDPIEAQKRAVEHADRTAKELEAQIAKAQQVLDELRQAKVWLQYHQNLALSAPARDWWQNEGIPPLWQDHWQLGWVPEKHIWCGEDVVTPTATIPIFSAGWNCQQVKHRLVKAPTEAGKYRYEYQGLPSAPFICNPDLPTDESCPTVIIEGEKKSMVFFSRFEHFDYQVIGAPGKRNSFDTIVKLVERADPLYLCFDPDAQAQQRELAALIGEDRVRILEPVYKIDDQILLADWQSEDIQKFLNSSRGLRSRKVFPAPKPIIGV